MGSTRILYVDDDDNDRELMKAAAEAALGRKGTIVCLSHVEEAIRYLIGEGPFSDRSVFPFPTLVITDLKMPQKDGLHLLEFLRHNPGWSVVPRVVVSSSADADDVKKVFMLGASAFHDKLSCGGFAQLIPVLLGYWKLSQLPPVDETGRMTITDSRGKIGERYSQPAGGESMERIPEPNDKPADRSV